MGYLFENAFKENLKLRVDVKIVRLDLFGDYRDSKQNTVFQHH